MMPYHISILAKDLCTVGAECFINDWLVLSAINSGLDNYNQMITDFPVAVLALCSAVLNVAARESFWNGKLCHQHFPTASPSSTPPSSSCRPFPRFLYALTLPVRMLFPTYYSHSSDLRFSVTFREASSVYHVKFIISYPSSWALDYCFVLCYNLIFVSLPFHW